MADTSDSGEEKFRVDPTQMMRRYIMALGLLLVFILGGYGLNVYTAKLGVLDAQVINVSGRQRMLSQRIVLLASRYVETQSEVYRSKLEQGVTQFAESHDWLVENAIAPGSAAETHYFSVNGARLDERSREFVVLAQKILAADAISADLRADVAWLEDEALNDLLVDLNFAVSLFEQSANARLDALRNIQLATVVLTITVLLLEIVLVFYPSHLSMTGVISKLRYQALNDQLTGLANRVQFMEHVRKAFERAPDSQDRICILALDLDGFKDVNDTLGHPAGDQVLVHVARSIEKVLAQANGLSDSIGARIGGDEFLICTRVEEGDVLKRAQDLGQQVIDAVELPITVSLDGARQEKCIVGVSIGYAFAADTVGNIELFLSNADIALYESKRRGKGVATAFEPSMREAAELRHHRTQELKVGLKSLEFQAFFQPQIDLTTGRLFGVEALARWRHPKHGLVGPKDFLAFADECNMLDTLDGQVILNALEAFSQSKANGIDLGRLSLNTSEASLRDPDFCDLLLRIADLHNVHPGEVTIEVLEEVLIHGNADPALTTIRNLASAGFGIAIDDFGIGQSSLSRVSHLNVSCIKIDRSLTVQAGTQAMQKILAATSAMAQGLGARLIAEGVETPAQMSELKDFGVEVAQGYLWSKPLPIDQMNEWASARRGGIELIRQA